MANLLSSTEERVYFKDLHSRFLLVSAGWVAAISPGSPVDQIIGKSDFDFFSKEHAESAYEDEQQVIRTGEPIVGKLERETFNDGVGSWVSTSKMPLRDAAGRTIGTFGISRDVTAQIKAEDALAYQVLHDPVTGLANRVALMDRLSQALLALERRPGRLAVLYVDLDGFKQINDSFGHASGDQVLSEVGRRLSALSRHVDTVARIGGDEFVVLCGELREDEDVAIIADRIVLGSPGALRRGRTRPLGHLQRRHRRHSRSAGGARPAHPGRRRGDVCRQASRAQSLLCPRRLPAVPRREERPARRAEQGRRERRALRPLPTPLQSRGPCTHRSRGAGPVAPSPAGSGATGRVHPLRRTAWPDRQNRRLRLERSLPPAGGVDRLVRSGRTCSPSPSTSPVASCPIPGLRAMWRM